MTAWTVAHHQASPRSSGPGGCEVDSEGLYSPGALVANRKSGAEA
jgi:hypothetical protein